MPPKKGKPASGKGKPQRKRPRGLLGVAGGYDSESDEDYNPQPHKKEQKGQVGHGFILPHRVDFCQPKAVFQIIKLLSVHAQDKRHRKSDSWVVAETESLSGGDSSADSGGSGTSSCSYSSGSDDDSGSGSGETLASR